MSDQRLGAWDSVRILGIHGGRASGLSLPYAVSLLGQGVSGERRRRALVARVVDGFDPRAGRDEVLTALDLLADSSLAPAPEMQAVLRSAVAVADPPLLRRLADWLGPEGAELAELAGAECRRTGLRLPRHGVDER